MKRFCKNSAKIALAAVVALTGCQRPPVFSTGDPISFTVSTKGDPQSKAKYSGESYESGSKKYERIDWQKGDQIRIYCAAASEPSTHFADYQVESDGSASGEKSKATISSIGSGLCWGTGSHVFYSVYPSPAQSGVSTGIEENIVSCSMASEQNTLSGSLSGTGNYVISPDLKWLLMAAKSASYTPDDGPKSGDVILAFNPLSTAIKFVVTNKSGSAMAIKKLMLFTKESPISGVFSVDIDNNGSDGFLKVTPAHSGAGVTEAEKQVTITPAGEGINLAVGETLTFTFFLAPNQDVEDLSLKIFKGDGSWMSTAFKYTDGTGVKFYRCRKHTAEGILIPEGAQWTIKYDPDVENWGTVSGDITLDPDFSAKPFVTSWDTGSEESLPMSESTSVPKVSGNIVFNYEGGTSSLKVISSQADAAYPWSVQYKDGDSWKDVKPAALDWLSVSPASGSGSLSGETVTLTVNAAASSSSEKTITVEMHNDILRNAPQKGTADRPFDLSTHNIFGGENPDALVSTANSYVINSAGWYAFPLVYGNAIKKGMTNTASYAPTAKAPAEATAQNFLSQFRNANNAGISSPYLENDLGGSVSSWTAYPLWQDVENFAIVADNACSILTKEQAAAKGLTANCAYVLFQVKPDNLTQGNVLIAVNNGSKIVWSWHIWMTDENLEPKKLATTGVEVLPFNLGWVGMGDTKKTVSHPAASASIRIVQKIGGTEVPGEVLYVQRMEHTTKAYCTNGSSNGYQWGRKDPFIRNNANPSDTNPGYIGTYSVHGGGKPTIFYKNSNNPGLNYSINNPSTFIHGTDRNNPENVSYGQWFNEGVDVIYRNLWSANSTRARESGSGDGFDTAAVKTVYDPCPPGFQVPQTMAFISFNGGAGGDSGWVREVLSTYCYDPNFGRDKGYNFYTDKKDIGECLFFPAEGLRSSDHMEYVGSLANYYTAVQSWQIKGSDSNHYFPMQLVLRFGPTGDDTSKNGIATYYGGALRIEANPIRPAKEVE